MKKLLPYLFIFFSGSTMAQTNWAEDIAPIMFKNCTKCHHNGGLAPFPLMTYTDAAAVQLGMMDAVNDGRMPPWPPDPDYTRFAHERLLTAAEIATINDWVNTGALQGNLSNAPPTPVYNNTSVIGVPDLTISIPTYTVVGTSDIYRCFPLPSNLTALQYITAMEVIPGNPSIVHHVLVYADDAATCYTLDSADPGPGYTNFGGTGSNLSKLIGAWVPGTEPYTLPVNMGVSLNANTNIIIQIHYPAGSLGMIDSTKINFKLTPGPIRDVSIFPLLNHSITLVNGPIAIPANQTRTYHEQYTITNAMDFSVLSIAPHMHLIGRTINVYAVTPVGDTIPMIKIDNWDFKWQGAYSFQKVLKIPAGSTLHAFAFYDNTSNNILNPNIPPQWVGLGESTTDEMMLVYFFFLPYLPGDENIVQDSTAFVGIHEAYSDMVVTPQLYDVYPNPAAESLNLSFYLSEKETVSIELTDINGKLLKWIMENESIASGLHQADADISNLAPGKYFITMHAADWNKTKAFLVE